MTGTYSLTVLEIWRLKSKCLQSCAPSGGSEGENPVLASACLWLLVAFLGLWPLLSLVHFHIAFSSMCLLCMSLIRTLVIGFKAHRDSPRDLLILITLN